MGWWTVRRRYHEWFLTKEVSVVCREIHWYRKRKPEAVRLVSQAQSYYIVHKVRTPGLDPLSWLQREIVVEPIHPEAHKKRKSPFWKRRKHSQIGRLQNNMQSCQRHHLCYIRVNVSVVLLYMNHDWLATGPKQPSYTLKTRPFG